MARQDVLERMAAARTRFDQVVLGVDTVASERPLAPGKLSIREHTLHLHAWDLLALEALEPAARGVEPAWAHIGREETDRLNQAHLSPLRSNDWDAARGLLEAGRRRLIEAIDNLPEREGMWLEEHALGAMLLDLAWNDDHHAEIIRRWRADQGI